jgi:hypothetical protein
VSILPHVSGRNVVHALLKIGYETLIKQKSRRPQIQDAKGEAVVSYCEPLATQIEKIP